MSSPLLYKDAPMPLMTPSPRQDTPLEHLAGSVERVTFHSEETGFCVLRVTVCGHRDLVTVVGTAPTITPGEFIEGESWWVTDRTHGLQFKTTQLHVVPRPRSKASSAISAPAWSKALARTLPTNWCRPSAPRSSTSSRRRPPACRNWTASV